MGRPDGFKQQGDPHSLAPDGPGRPAKTWRPTKVAPPTYEGMSEETASVDGTSFSTQPNRHGISVEGGHIDAHPTTELRTPSGNHVLNNQDEFADNHEMMGGTLDGSSVTTVPLGGRGTHPRRKRRGG